MAAKMDFSTALTQAALVVVTMVASMAGSRVGMTAALMVVPMAD